MKAKFVKRALAWVLSLCLVVGLVPASILAAAAASDATIVIAASDYQNTAGGLFSSGAATDAYAIMSQIKEDYDSAYGFLFGGDYFAHRTNTTTESTNGKNQLKGEIVDALYPDMADDTQVYIQGNHDADVLTTNGTLATSGAHDTEKYGVYVINEKDYMWHNDNQTTIRNTATALDAYLDAKVAAGYKKPIFVLSHLPLHYTNRTAKEGDGKYAKYLYDVLDEAGDNNLNIIFLYGHNHSTAYDSYLGNGSVYLPEGSSIAIANEGSTFSYFTDTLSFTYMNYGFVGYVGSSDTDGALTMTVFEITDTSVAVKRYDENGLHNLKAAGGSTQLPSGLSANTDVIGTDGATFTLTTPVVRSTYIDGDVTVTAAGITGVTATANTVTEFNTNLYSDYESYTVTAAGYANGTVATVTITLPESLRDADTVLLFNKATGVTLELQVSDNGTVTFDTAGMGIFELAQRKTVEIEVPGTSTGGGSGNGTIWRRVTTMTAGRRYMLVNYGDNASGVGTFAVNSSAGGTAVTVLNDSTGPYIENSNMALAWTYNDNAELTNADTNRYLYIANYPSGTNGVALAVTASVNTGTSYSSWKLAQNTALNETSLSAYRNGSSNYYPARWSNRGAEYLAYTSTQNSKHDNWIAVFEQTSEGGDASSSVTTSGGNWVTITKPVAGGTTTYTYTQDTNGVNTNTAYLIVNSSSAVTLENNGTSGITTAGISIDGTTATTNTQDYEWKFDSSNRIYTTINGKTYYLRATSSGWNGASLSLSNSSSNATQWSISNNNGAYTISVSISGFIGSSTYYLTTSGISTTRGTVRLFAYEDSTTSGGTDGLYGKISGELTYNVSYGTSEEEALAKVKEGITVYWTTEENATTGAVYGDDAAGMTWDIVDYDPETPGEYAVNISYNDVLLGTAKVVVPDPDSMETITVYIDSDSGMVNLNASATAYTGSYLVVTDANGDTKKVLVSVGMLKDADGNAVSTATAGILTGLKVYYEGEVICDDYTLVVREKVTSQYPEYPDEGAVKVDKTATGVDFQSTGVAKVELSASGVPVKKGADVIVMVDTSSSMKRGANTNSEVSAPNRRIDFLQTAIASLIEQFQMPGEDGDPMDIRLAIAEFNGYRIDGSYAISGNNYLNGTGQQTANNTAEVFTGDGSKGVGAFVQATSIKDPATFAANIGEHSGTNYDYAFDTVYRLGSAIRTESEQNQEERDLYVIFMSDGAPYQYNYYGSGTVNSWNGWLTGDVNTALLTGDNTHFYNADGKHWMAEAIKGSTTATYPVIDPEEELGTDASDDYGNYFRYVPGLGAQIHSIGFCVYDDAQSGGTVTADTAKTVLSNIASLDSTGAPMYHYTDSGSGLSEIFCDIGSEIAYAAYGARFVDNMGSNFDLQLSTTINTIDQDGKNVTVDLTEHGLTNGPVITVQTYDIYTRAEAENGLCTMEMVGMRKSSDPTVLETVAFSADGSKAYSNMINVDGDSVTGFTVNSDGTYTFDEGDNILGTDGVIYARYFAYNTSAATVMVDANADNTDGKEYALASETFYWNIGTITNKEIALSYYVYLVDSMSGGRDAGAYETNESAILYYTNYLGTENCEKHTVSPKIAWKSANVSYGFYLVDANGNPIVNQATGQTGTFANAVRVTAPQIYNEILLNNLHQVNSINVSSLGVLPDGYSLYDAAATYTIVILSDSTGSWTIEQGNGKTQSTYVTQFSTSTPYSNATYVTDESYDYTHTIVWFAVLFEIKPIPDTVVIDYGLSVDISVLANDMFAEKGKLYGVDDEDNKPDSLYTSTVNGFGTTLNATYGTAEVNTTNGTIKYTPNTMQMPSYDRFAYAVNYTGSSNAGYYYSLVTVIPATSVYYEDNGGWITYGGTATWGDVEDGSKADSQGEDRPGTLGLSGFDANNIYGYDGAYATMSTYSNGSAKKVTVDANTFANAKFSFYGTGFDVISMTSSQTGVLKVKVFDAEGGRVANMAVDTYYGYTKDADGNWAVTNDAANALYQVPVIQISGLDYGLYSVEITASYYDALNNQQDGSYDLYLDAIRVYDPAGTTYDATDTNGNETQGNIDDVIQDAYLTDGEAWPRYFELRSNVIDAAVLSNGVSEIAGLVFIDGVGATASATDYTNFGPNNELYLDAGQAVAFNLDLDGYDVAAVHLGIKSANGVAASYQIFDANKVKIADDLKGIAVKTVNTATDMYYDITSLKGKTIVVYNSGTAGILSLTDIKVTFNTDPGEIGSLFMVDAATIADLTNRLNKTYTPEYITVTTSPKKVYVGNTIHVTVTTSADVEAVDVNGTVIDTYRVRNGKRIWTYNVKAESTQTFTVTAYGTEAYYTYTTDAVPVEAGTHPLVTIINALKKIFGWS